MTVKAFGPEMEGRACERPLRGAWRRLGKLLVRERPPTTASGAGRWRDPVAIAGFTSAGKRRDFNRGFSGQSVEKLTLSYQQPEVK